MAEPIRKPVHRPRPPHPHTQSRPHALLVRSRMLPQELDPTPLPPQELPAPAPVPLTLLPPKVRTAPLRTAPPPSAPRLDSRPDPLPTPPAALVPPDDLTLVQSRVERGRSARRLLLGALALHGGALLAALLPGPASNPAFHLGSGELVLAGCVLLSGGMMLVLGRR
jgi:hypothetical protein